jgi:hypothetical protein
LNNSEINFETVKVTTVPRKSRTSINEKAVAVFLEILSFFIKKRLMGSIKLDIRKAITNGAINKESLNSA